MEESLLSPGRGLFFQVDTPFMQPPTLKLAMMSSQTNWGGGEQFVWSLGRGLIDRGHEVLWFADPSSPLAQKVRGACLPLVPVPSRMPKPRDLLRIRRRCTQEGIQVVHANDSHALTSSSLALLGKSGIKRVGVKHTAFPIRSAVRYNWMLDTLACVSQAVRKLCIESGIAERKTTVIHGGIEPPTSDRTSERFRLCEELQIQSSVPIFSAVGSLIPCKAYHRLIEAAHHLRWHLPDFRIVICGEGKLRGELESLVRKYDLADKVKLLGFQNQPERWIAGSDAFVHPSMTEGLSLVAIQAQMLGVPVVASDCDGLGEVMKNPYTAAELGWIIRGDDPSNLAELMLNALQNTPERHERLRAAKQSALDRFHLDRMINGFENLYFKLSYANTKPQVKAARRAVA